MDTPRPIHADCWIAAYEAGSLPIHGDRAGVGSDGRTRSQAPVLKLTNVAAASTRQVGRSSVPRYVLHGPQPPAW